MFLPRASALTPAELLPARPSGCSARQLPAQMPAFYSQFWRGALRGALPAGASDPIAGLARNPSHPVLILSGHRLRPSSQSRIREGGRPLSPVRRRPIPAMTLLRWIKTAVRAGRDSVIAVRAAV